MIIGRLHVCLFSLVLVGLTLANPSVVVVKEVEEPGGSSGLGFVGDVSKLTTIKFRPFDYKAFENNSLVKITPATFGLSDSHVEGLFYDEIEKIRQEGPANRHWDIFADFLPRSMMRSKKKKTERTGGGGGMRRVFTRDVFDNIADLAPMVAAPRSVRNSPLAVSLGPGIQKGI